MTAIEIEEAALYAIARGADWLVIGRSVTGADDLAHLLQPCSRIASFLDIPGQTAAIFKDDHASSPLL